MRDMRTEHNPPPRKLRDSKRTERANLRTNEGHGRSFVSNAEIGVVMWRIVSTGDNDGFEMGSATTAVKRAYVKDEHNINVILARHGREVYLKSTTHVRWYNNSIATLLVITGLKARMYEGLPANRWIYIHIRVCFYLWIYYDDYYYRTVTFEVVLRWFKWWRA